METTDGPAECHTQSNESAKAPPLTAAPHGRRHSPLNEGQSARYGVPVPLVAGTERPVQPKKKGWDFYRAIGSPKLVAAPMVDQSEYAWRLLSRKYGADLCYTPMWHAKMFSDPNNSKYRNEMWQAGTTGDDEPLFVQFCANDPAALLAAARIVEPFCDAVDLNLGCPQGIAKKGHYGAFLMEEWDLIASLVRTLDHGLERVPVTAKIRVFETVEKTVAYAKMVEAAGASIVVVHGRLREQKGHLTGLADWSKIRAVKEALSVPVFANGNILYPEDIERCFRETGVDAVMAAETNLYHPAFFKGLYPPVWQVAEEYLQICQTVPNSAHESYIKAHMFKIFRPCLGDHPDLRDVLVSCRSVEDYVQFVARMAERMKKVAEEDKDFEFPFVPKDPPEKDADGYLCLPRWVTQPYIRPDTVAMIKGVLGPNDAGRLKAEAETATKRVRVDSDGPAPLDGEEKTAQSPKVERKPKKPKINNTCTNCSNVRSPTCGFGACKKCCSSICAQAFNDWPEDLVFGKSGAKNDQINPADQPNDVDRAAQGEDMWEWAVICEGHKRRIKVRRGVFGGIENGKAVLKEGHVAR